MPEGFSVIECPYCQATFRHLWGAGISADIRVYWYANRWVDDDGIAHHFGVQSPEATLSKAQEQVTFNMIDCPVKLVFGPVTYPELMEYLADMNPNRDLDDFDD